MLAVGIAQVQPGGVSQVGRQLLGQRLVQSEALAQLRDEGFVRRAGLARHDGGRVAGRGADQQEIDDRDQGQHQQALRDAAHQVSEFLHGIPPVAGLRAVQASVARARLSFKPMPELIKFLMLLR